IPVSSQMLRCSAGLRRWSSSRTARKLDPRSVSSDAPAHHVRSGAGTWTVIVVARAKALAGVSWGGMEPGEVRGARTGPDRGAHDTDGKLIFWRRPVQRQSVLPRFHLRRLYLSASGRQTILWVSQPFYAAACLAL